MPYRVNSPPDLFGEKPAKHVPKKRNYWYIDDREPIWIGYFIFLLLFGAGVALNNYSLQQRNTPMVRVNSALHR